MKLLIVDDSKAMRMIIIRTLKAAGFSGLETIEAASGVEALDLLSKETPDLVLSDWNMPEMNGIELLKQLRANGNDIRFGFITSESGAETLILAKEAGAEFVITKPFSPEKFESILSPIFA